jgi:hypothetical protein
MHVMPRPSFCVPHAAALRSRVLLRCAVRTQDENSDLLRESLSCALKLPAADDAADIDDDGRPIQRAPPPKP